MKIILCVKRDLEGLIALNHLLRELPHHQYWIWLSDRYTKQELSLRATRQFIFLERDLLLHHYLPLWRALGPNLPQDRFRGFSELSEQHNAPLRIVKNINHPLSIARLQEIEPDLILSIRYDLILRQSALEIPRLGAYNIHPGALPEYRGVYACMRAIANHQSHASCTLHRMDATIDTGPVVEITSLEVQWNRSVLWHLCSLYTAGVHAFVRMMQRLEQGKFPAHRPQDDSSAMYYSFFSQAEFDNFEKTHIPLFNAIDYDEILRLFCPIQIPKQLKQ